MLDGFVVAAVALVILLELAVLFWVEEPEPVVLFYDPLVGFDGRPFFGVGEVTFCCAEAALPALGLPILVLLAIILVLFPSAFDNCCTLPIGEAELDALLVLFDCATV